MARIHAGAAALKVQTRNRDEIVGAARLQQRQQRRRCS
jgi:hypothetical protein